MNTYRTDNFFKDLNKSAALRIDGSERRSGATESTMDIID
jgi:hypothetical protein